MGKAARWVSVALLLAGCTPGAPPQPASSEPSQLPTVSAGSGGTNRPEQRDKPYLILISFDGFRHDYMDRSAAPNFQRVARLGVRARGLIPAFPSKTFPNHYSIVTGQYPQTHGIVGNRFFDPARGETYALGDLKSVTDGSWYRSEPIWVTAEKQGMVAASYFWVGSEAAIQGIRPTYWKEYKVSVPNAHRVDSVLAWLRKPAEHRPHMITLYMSDVDNAGHIHGPESRQVEQAVLAVDSALGRLLDGIETLPIRSQTYVVLVSDHGMASYTPETAVAIGSLIDTAGVMVTEVGPNANLHVRGGPARALEIRDALNRGLKHGRAYLRQDIPARLHYRSDPRIGDVVVIMKEHFQIVSRIPSSAGGSHGWDPVFPSMHGIFLAMGPGMRTGFLFQAFENIHIYPFMVEVLGLKSARGVDARAGWLRRRVMVP